MKPRQDGIALLGLLAVIVLGASWWLVSALATPASRVASDREHNAKVLAQAKLALIGTVGLNDTEYLDFPLNECPADRPNTDGDAGGFDFVLEVYTIQPLPIEMRMRVIDAIANFVSENGRLLVVTRGREDDETPDEVPWPVSRGELRRFEENGLQQIDFIIMESDENDEPDRFVVEYLRNSPD